MCWGFVGIKIKKLLLETINYVHCYFFITKIQDCWSTNIKYRRVQNINYYIRIYSIHVYYFII
jgi:hypothetical protein